MLNYIWLALFLLGITIAVGTDWYDLSTDKYHNGENVAVFVEFTSGPATAPVSIVPRPCIVTIAPNDFNKSYGTSVIDTVRFKAEVIFDAAAQELSAPPRGAIRILADEQMPAPWKLIQSAQKDPSALSGRLALSLHEGKFQDGTLMLEPVRFSRLNAVTNEGIIKYAKTAVELAIGLIGLMAVWLGLMKVAEEAGIVRMLARMLKPITTLLFPDVPPDHPAMGAMIMNIAANMLGLSNAATPLGLKAMEELNKLNKKVGTATDAMCTFLVINTSNVQIIPATVIAIRSASGSSNPTEIIGPVILATALNLIISVTMVKLLARLPVFRNQLRGAI